MIYITIYHFHDLIFPPFLEWLLWWYPYTMLQCHARNLGLYCSFPSFLQIRIIQRYVEDLLAARGEDSEPLLSPQDIGIITPYARQVRTSGAFLVFLLGRKVVFSVMKEVQLLKDQFSAVSRDLRVCNVVFFWARNCLLRFPTLGN